MTKHRMPVALNLVGHFVVEILDNGDLAVEFERMNTNAVGTVYDLADDAITEDAKSRILLASTGTMLKAALEKMAEQGEPIPDPTPTSPFPTGGASA